MVDAARLRAELYEEVEADESALGQAVAVVVLSSVAAGIGAAEHGLDNLFWGMLGALASWLVWAFLTWIIGSRVFPEPQTRATLGELLRTIGFAASPGLLRVFGAVPLLGPLVYAVAVVWMLVAMVIAVRQALDYASTARAFGVAVIGWVLQTVLVAWLTF